MSALDTVKSQFELIIGQAKSVDVTDNRAVPDTLSRQKSELIESVSTLGKEDKAAFISYARDSIDALSLSNEQERDLRSWLEVEGWGDWALNKAEDTKEFATNIKKPGALAAAGAAFTGVFAIFRSVSQERLFSFSGLLSAAVAAVGAVSVYTNWDSISQWAQGKYNDVKEKVTGDDVSVNDTPPTTPPDEVMASAGDDKLTGAQASDMLLTPAATPVVSAPAAANGRQ